MSLISSYRSFLEEISKATNSIRIICIFNMRTNCSFLCYCRCRQRRGLECLPAVVLELLLCCGACEIRCSYLPVLASFGTCNIRRISSLLLLRLSLVISLFFSSSSLLCTSDSNCNIFIRFTTFALLSERRSTM